MVDGDGDGDLVADFRWGSCIGTGHDWVAELETPDDYNDWGPDLDPEKHKDPATTGQFLW